MKKNIIFVLILTGMVCFSSGCDLLLRIVQKQRFEEKEILGETYKYNDEVRKLQYMLNEIGYNPGAVDGKMGYRTRDALKEFQSEYDLKPGGYLGEKTWEKIKAIYKEKLSFENINVTNIQKALLNSGFDPGPIDGKMGPKTKAAIKSFQEYNNITIDGKVGRDTWEILRDYLLVDY